MNSNKLYIYSSHYLIRLVHVILLNELNNCLYVDRALILEKTLSAAVAIVIQVGLLNSNCTECHVKTLSICLVMINASILIRY